MKKDVVLDVPYHSEFTSIDGSKKHIDVFKRRSCGIVSAKMIIDFWASKKNIKKISIDRLIEKASKKGAYSSISESRNITGEGKKDTGWIHAGMVRLFQDIGFISWRRMWFLRDFDLSYFENEGVNSESLDGYYTQIQKEAFKSFIDNINVGFPFLVNISKNMGMKKSPHIIVLTGYRMDSKGDVVGFFINDPHNPKGGRKEYPVYKNKFISVKKFDSIWRRRAIFISPS